MDTVQFAYWLKGFFEISDATKLNEKETQIIKDHLDLIFNKVTPNRIKIEKEKQIEKTESNEFPVSGLFDDSLNMPLCQNINQGKSNSKIVCSSVNGHAVSNLAGHKNTTFC